MREHSAGIEDLAKDRWNREVERAVRRVQETDWREVGREVEEAALGAWERIRKSGGGEK